jgi:uncharacterized protein (TIGR02246 family)
MGSAVEAAVGDFFEQVTKAWDSNDGEAFGAQFTDDGTLINPFGERATGRAEVTAMYVQYFAGMLGGTTSTVQVQSLREIDRTNALVDADQNILAPDGTVVLAVHLTALLRLVDGEWRFVDARPYAFAQPPA